MRLGVTGAFGFLGANVVAEALAQGRDVVAFSSRASSHPLFDAGRVETRRLDLLDPASARAGFRGLDAVIHLAGIADFRRSRRRAVWEVNVLGSRNVYEAALHAGLGRLVDVSSVNALGPGNGEPVTEENADPYRPGNVTMFASAAQALAAVESSDRGELRFLSRSRVTYFDAKTAAHELRRAWVRERSLPAVALFPGTAVGPGDVHGGISVLVDGVWDGRLGMTVGGSTSFMDSRDFARGVLLALDRGTDGGEYILAGRSERGTGYAEFMRQVALVAAEREGREPPRRDPLVMPAGLAALAAAVAEPLAPGLGLSLGLALSGALVQSFSSARAMRELGYDPSANLRPAIVACREFSRARKNYYTGV